MPAEQELWVGKPSFKVLTADLIGASLFALALGLGVAFVFAPALAAIGRMSEAAGRAIALNRPGLSLAAVVFVVFVAGQRFVRLIWRGLVLRGPSYQLSHQRLLGERGGVFPALRPDRPAPG